MPPLGVTMLEQYPCPAFRGSRGQGSGSLDADDCSSDDSETVNGDK